MLNKSILTVLSLLQTLLLLSGAEKTLFHFDFEQGSGTKLPPQTQQVRGRDCGGVVEVAQDKTLVPYTKSLRITADRKKPDARFLIRKKIPVQSGNTLLFEARLKGKGTASFGVYAYRKNASMAYYAVTAKVDSEQWQRVVKEIPLSKEGIFYVYVFLQCHRGEVQFSPFTVRVKGISSGTLELEGKQRTLSWKKSSGKGTLSPLRDSLHSRELSLKLQSTAAPQAICSDPFETKAGDQVYLTFLARGKGILTAGIVLAGKNGKTETRPSKEKITLSPSGWKEYSSVLPIPNGKDFETLKGTLVFHLSGQSEVQITKIHLSREKGKYAGDTPFPAEATVFPLIPPTFQPSVQELTRIPPVLNGVRGQTAKTKCGQLDLARFMNGVKEKNCAWVYYKLHTPFACDYTLGAGADWFFTLYLNGKKVLDTSRNGNNGSHFSPLDQTAKVRLRKGENMIAVKFESGKSSSLLCVGGPVEIRDHAQEIERAGTLAADDYSADNGKRTSSPALVKRITIPGDMSMNRVGLYTKSTRIDPFRKSFFLHPESDHYFGQSILLVEFPSESSQNQFRLAFTSGKKILECVLVNKGKTLYTYIAENGKRVSPEFYTGHAEKIFPCDFTVYTDRSGTLRIYFSSRKEAHYSRKILWDSPLLARMMQAPFRIHAQILLKGKGSSLAVDDYAAVRGRIKAQQNRIPFLLQTEETFDPVKAGWKLIMEDDFNGTVIDTKKWKVDGRKDPHQQSVTLDGKGFLVIKADWNKEKTRLVTRRLWSQRTFRYGYFEARLRFTKQPGWWSSFFMMSPVMGGPFYGVEFDFYEDYFTRPERPGASFRKILDSTAYAGYPRMYKFPAKIWNYHSVIPGSLDDFYTLGVKWTPFEISYYLNGKRLPGFLKHSPHNTVTFDAFNHCAVACGTQMVFAGEIGMGNAKLGTFPETFRVDYFRAYEMPKDDLPRVRWIHPEKRNVFVKKGETLHFEVRAEPSSKTRSSIRGAYLFDNGYFIAKKETPPYRFSIPMTEEFYKSTRYKVPGLSKGTPMNPPLLEGPFPHSFAVFVQDEKGNAAMTSILPYILQEEKKSTPYQGKPQVIPGVVHLPFYDEGGQEAAYYWSEKGGRDQTFRKEERVYATKGYVENHQACNYLKFTVNVKKSATYDVTLRYACVSPPYTDSWAKLYVNGREKAHFTLENAGRYSMPSQKVTVKGIPLSKGKNVLLVMLNMKGFAADLTFQEAK